MNTYYYYEEIEILEFSDSAKYGTMARISLKGNDSTSFWVPTSQIMWFSN